jgi:hypothetical protein
MAKLGPPSHHYGDTYLLPFLTLGDPSLAKYDGTPAGNTILNKFCFSHANWFGNGNYLPIHFVELNLIEPLIVAG